MSYEIKAISGKGNAVVATNKINEGALIFKDIPQYFHIFDSSANSHNITCLCNGCSYYFNKCAHNEEFSCISCGNNYCSQKCREFIGLLKSKASHNIENFDINPTSGGHRWTCNVDKRLLKELDSHNETNYFRLALQTYSIIAEMTFESMKASSSDFDAPINTVSVNTSVNTSASKAMSGFQASDYCLSLHRLVS